MNRTLKLVATFFIAMVAIGGIATVAWAYFTSHGSGAADAGIGSFAAPTNAHATANGGAVTVTWTDTAAPTGDPVDGYYVERISGSTIAPACGTTSANLVPSTNGPTCADDNVSDGTYTYRVIAVWRSWTATSDESIEVTVVNDSAAPDATVTFPVNGQQYSASAYAAGCSTGTADICGTATDTAGVALVRVSIKNQTNNKYWDGTGFTLTPETFQAATLTPATGTAVSWGCALPTPATGGYTVHVQAKDANGNEQTGTTYAAASTFTVDVTAPTVSSVSSTLANGRYKASQPVPVTVTYSEIVDVIGVPQLTLETGSADRDATYTGGTGTNTLTFDYTVAAGDTSADLDYTSATSLALNGGTIRDAVLNDATLTLPDPGTTGSLGANGAIVIDTTAPTVTNVTSTLGNGSYKAGQVVPVTLTFSETVDVSTAGGVPQLTLETGATDRNASYASGGGSSSLVFSYTVQSGDTSGDLDYLSTSALSLDGGVIQDLATNPATLTLPDVGLTGSLGANQAIVIDTTPPTVTVARAAGQNAATNTAPITFDVTFSEPVNGFVAADITRSGVTTGTLTVSPSGRAQTFQISITAPSSQGAVTVNVGASVANDDAANSNTAAASSTSVTWDTVAPTLAHTTSPASPNGSNGWYKSGDVTVDFAVPADSGAGIATSSGCTDTTISADTSSTLLPCSATDNAGNAASDDVTIKRDTVAPAITPTVTGGTLGSNGWYKAGSPVVSWAGTDATSGVAVTPCTSTTVSADTTGQLVSCTVSDNAGNSGSGSVTIKRDTVAPTINRVALAPIANTTTSGFLRQGSEYYVYANVVDATSGAGSATANVANVTTGSTSVALVSGSYTAFGTTYNFRSDVLTANASLAEGALSYSVSGADDAGNATAAVTSGSVTIDNTAPTVTITSITANNSGKTITVTGTASRGAGDVLNVTVVLCSNNSPTCAGGTVRATLTGTVNPTTGAFSVTSGNLNNLQSWARATQDDQAGNTGASAVAGPVTP